MSTQDQERERTLAATLALLKFYQENLTDVSSVRLLSGSVLQFFEGIPLFF